MQTEIPPKFRDLSTRYGKNGSATKRHPDDVIPSINFKHPIFVLMSSFAFAALYAELLFFVATYYGNKLGTATNIAIIAADFVLVFATVYASFTLPHRYYMKRFHEYSPIVFLVMEWIVAVVMMLFMTAVSLVAGIFLVDGDLGAVGEVLRSLSLYAMMAIVLYQGIVVYVRYVRYLYEREMHQSYKIVTFTGVLAVIVFLLTLYLLQFDLGRMGGSLPNQGWLSLHLSIRDVALLATTLFVFAWHATILADH